MLLDPHTLDLFSHHKTEILAANPMRQEAIHHNRGRWQETLATNPVASQVLQVCDEYLNGDFSLTRERVLKAVDDRVDVQARFLMQMIWGFPSNDNRAYTKVLGYFQSPVMSDQVRYQRLIKLIHAGELQQAHDELMGGRGLSTSYITKVLYFESRRMVQEAGKKYALIMDDRVSAAILKVTSPWAAQCLNVMTPRPLLTKSAGVGRTRNQLQQSWLKYWAYVEGCHEIANHLGTDTDHVESFLFDYGK